MAAGGLSGGGAAGATIAQPAARRFVPRRQPCLFVLVCALAGIALGEAVRAPAWLVLGTAAGMAAMLLRWRSLSRVWLQRASGFMLVTLYFGLHQAGWHEAPGRKLADALLAAGGVREFEVVVTGDAARLDANRAVFEGRVARVDGAAVDLPALCVVRGERPEVGNRLKLTAVLSRPRPPLNPGQLDYAGYLARRGIFAELNCRHPNDVEVLAREGAPWPESWLRAAREWLEGAITRGLEFDPVAQRVITGVALGETGALPPELTERFQMAGALHVFSVSGLHVGMVGLLAWMVFGAVGLGPRARAAAALCAVWLYAAVTGGSVPAVRAAVMATAVAGGIFVMREASAANSIGAAGALILAADTNAAFQAGFQLSFGAVLALVLLAERFAAPLKRMFEPDPLVPRKLVPAWQRILHAGARRFVELLSVSLAAGLGTSFFSAWHFALVTPGGVVSNIFAVPLAFCVVSISLLSGLLSIAAPGLGVLANNANWLAAFSLTQTALFFGSQPWSSVPGHPSAWLKPANELWVLAMDDGSSAVLRANGSTWLIGAGSREGYARVVRPFLRWYGIGRLDGLILPQGDSRHYGGAAQCVAEMRPRRIIQAAVEDRSPTRAALNEALKQAGVSWEEVAAGGVVELRRGARFRVLYPPERARARLAEERSLVLRLEGVPGMTALIFGSPPFLTQARLLELGREELAADVCVMRRSRSDPLVEPGFIRAVGAPLWIWTGINDFSTTADAAIAPEWALDVMKTGAVRVRPGPRISAEGYRAGPLELR